MQSSALINLARINWSAGDYFVAQVHANKAQRLAKISADLYREADSLCIAEIHKLKSEYVATHSIHFEILQKTSVDQDYYGYGLALLNVAEIDVSLGAPKENVQSVYEKAREIFSTRNLVTEVVMCDTILADLYLREGNFPPAKTLFEGCLKSVTQPEIMSYCLERLGDASCWGASNWMSSWTTLFLVHSVRQKEKLGIYKALEFFGDVFLSQGDEHIATSLSTVALDRFTKMDVHRSRAECMLQLGDISKGEDVLEQHRKNLAHLAEPTAPSGTVDKMDDLSDIEDMDGLDLEDETALDPVTL
ncbi:hypothetical protein B0H13DRAFT_1929503 [Mycena leptocephala]|nr:hypothetical protein B0H13DRAFT_1929503 [Mycena leptocephala]